MNFIKNNKIAVLAVLLVVLGASVSALAVSLVNKNNQDKIDQSKNELSSLPSREIQPPVNSDPVNQIYESTTNSFLGDTSESSEVVSNPVDSTTSSQAPDPIQQPVTEPAPTPTPQPQPEPTPVQPVTETILASTFKSVGNYQTSGGVNITKTGNDAVLNFESDFSFGGAPDPVIYLCKDKQPSSVGNCIVLGALQSNQGSQSWALTAAEADQYQNPVVWCRAFGVLMGSI